MEFKKYIGKTIFLKGIIITFFLFSCSVFSQNEVGVHCTLKEGEKPERYTCKWYAYNKHNKAVLVEIKKTSRNCSGEITIKTYTKRINSNSSSFLDRDQFPCMNENKEKREYSIVSSKFVE